MKPHQSACPKINTLTTVDEMPAWIAKISQGPTSDAELPAIGDSQEEKNVFPSNELSKQLFYLKWSFLQTYKHKQYQIDSVGCVFVCVCTTVIKEQDIMTLNGNQGRGHGRSWRGGNIVNAILVWNFQISKKQQGNVGECHKNTLCPLMKMSEWNSLPCITNICWDKT